jgi:hypothetical protein
MFEYGLIVIIAEVVIVATFYFYARHMVREIAAREARIKKEWVALADQYEALAKAAEAVAAGADEVQKAAQVATAEIVEDSEGSGGPNGRIIN